MKISGSLKRLFAALLVFTMVCSMVSTQAFAAEDSSADVTWEQIEDQGLFESLISGRKVMDSQSTEPYDEEDVVRVSIFLAEESTLEAGFPSENIASNKKAMAYRSNLKMNQKRMANTISSKVEGKFDVVWNLTLAANVISADVKYGDINKIEAIRGVSKVVLENRYEPCVVDQDEPDMAISSDMVGSQAAWASGYTGAGSRVAIIDTGADTDHQSLSAVGFEYSLKKNAELLGKDYDEYVKSLDLLDVEEIASVLDQLNISRLSDDPADYFVTSKIAFGANYIDSNFVIDHDHDSQGGHGSHVTGIAAANKYIPVYDKEGSLTGFNDALESVLVQGNAPDAQILTMKVFGAKGGAYDSDYMAAIEDAIVLGADSVNLSLGSSNAGFSFSDGYEDVMDAITESGTTVCISSGNNYSWAQYTRNKYLYKDGVNYMTSGSPGSFTNSFTVASVNNDGTRANYFKFNNDRLFNYTAMSGGGVSAWTAVSGDYEYVMLDPALADQEADAFKALAEILNGKVAMSWRGAATVGAKANAAVENGAVGTILCNNQSGSYSASRTGYNYKLPVATISQIYGEYILQNSEKHETADGIVYYTGTLFVSKSAGGVYYNSEYLTMSSYSSWGVPENLELEPEITAPGGTIYSLGVTAGGKSYTNMSGTSMAAPQITGLTAVLGQYIRENDLENKTGLTERQLVQSLLMSTAVPAKDTNSKYYYPVIQQGSGLARVDLAAAAHSFILMNEDATASYADGKVKAELGDDPDRAGKYSFSFTINNLTDEARSYELSADMFTQAIRQDTYLDTLATPLAANVTWTVNGKVLDPEVVEGLLNCDYDGDGNIDTDDGQALLDWLVGNRDEIFNSEYADLDADEDIDTYDAYLFFLGLNKGTVIVPGSESAEVKVDIELLNIADFDFNGAYVEGYVFAKELLSADGVEGDVHSIPVLGYYGDWDEPSMYDLGSYMDYQYKTESRVPYLYSYNGYAGNNLGVTYAGEEDEYYFGGNPVVADATWIKERDAINSDDSISSINFALVRNAAAIRAFAKDAEGKDIYNYEKGEWYAAYYDANNRAFMSSQSTLKPGFDLSVVPEGDYVTVGVQAATGFNVNEADGKANWDAVGNGGTYAMTMRIDNTTPVISNIAYRESTSLDASQAFTKSICLTVQDNQYIAGVVVADEKGNVIGYVGADPEQEEGAKFDVAVDVTKYSGTKFLIAVSDYAYNTVTFKANLDKEEASGEINVEVTPDAAELIVGAKQKLTAVVTPWGAPNGTVTWTSSDESVAKVNEKGIVTAVGVGKAVITATSDADPTKFDTCEITSIILDYTLYGELQDESGNPLSFTWDMSKVGTTWETVAELSNYIQGSCASGKDDFFYNLVDGGGEIELVNFETGIVDVTYSNPSAVFDLTLSAAFKDADYLWGINGSYLYGPAPVAEGFTSGKRMNVSGIIGNAKLQAVASMGMVGENVERIALLDKNGKLWFLDIDVTSNAVVSSEGFATGMAGLSFPGYSGTPYNSMVAASDGILFVSYFNGDTNVIYRLQYVPETNSYKAKVCGDIGYNVWPGTLIKVLANEPAEETASFGTLNSVDDPVVEEPVEPETTLSTVAVAEDGTVTVTLVAGNAEGAVATTNGLVSVKYDPEVLEYVETSMNSDYSSVNAGNAGEVLIDFVDVDGIAAGLSVGTVTFKAKKCCDLSVEIGWSEENEESGDLFTETLDLECWHEDTELVGAVEPTCDEDGYSGDVVCKDCGRVISKGEVIPATGHDFDEEGVCRNCGFVKVPDTGDHSHTAFWSFTFLTAAFALVLIMRKRRVNG